jgi:hypothetical protein
MACPCLQNPNVELGPKQLQRGLALYAEKVVGDCHLGQAELDVFVRGDLLEVEGCDYETVMANQRCIHFIVVTTRKADDVQPADIAVEKYEPNINTTDVNVAVHYIAFNHTVSRFVLGFSKLGMMLMSGVKPACV